MNRIVPFGPAPTSIDLAFEPDFNLGAAQVRPSRHEVLLGGCCQVLEPRVMQVLVALGRARGETVTREELIRQCWDGRFVSDDAINRTISKLRALAQVDGGASFRIETRPRLGYRLFAQGASGDPKGAIASELAFASAPAAEGGSYAASVQNAPRPASWLRSRLSRPRRTAGLGVAMVALIGIATFVALRTGPATNAAHVRLAAFASLSPELPATLPESLREELIAAFGEDDAVILTTADSAGGPRSFALSGTVRRVEDKLRFTLKVQNEATGAVLLTESVDRPAAHVAIAPRQAAVSLSQVMRCGLSGLAHYPRLLPDSTLALYFQYCQELWSGTGEDNNRAMLLARRVAAAAPDFPGGWAGVAASAGYIVRASDAADRSKVRAEGTKAAGEALRRDPDNSQAWAARGNLLPARAYAEREQLYRKAVSVRPTDCSCELQDYGHFLASVGRWEEAIDQLRRGREMQPLGASANSSLAAALSAAGRDEEARPIIESAIRLWPDRAGLRRTRLRMAFWSGRYEDGLKQIADPSADFTDAEKTALTAALEAARSGSVERRMSAAKQVEQLVHSSGTSDSVAVAALGALGDAQAALAAAERLVARGGPSATRVLFEPTLQGAWHDPVFAKMVHRLGLTAYWRRSGNKPDFCMKANAPPVCRTGG